MISFELLHFKIVELNVTFFLCAYMQPCHDSPYLAFYKFYVPVPYKQILCVCTCICTHVCLYPRLYYIDQKYNTLQIITSITNYHTVWHQDLAKLHETILGKQIHLKNYNPVNELKPAHIMHQNMFYSPQMLLLYWQFLFLLQVTLVDLLFVSTDGQ